MPHFKLTVAYDGTAFVGWQRQANGPSIQGALEDALSTLDGAHVTVIGAGRTDAGVHALGQVASARLARTIDAATLVRALNANLPDTVRVVDAVDVPESFHAQFLARSKTYGYRLWNDPVLSPFARPYVWHLVPPALDLEAMRRAAALLEGRKDFAAFQAAPPTASTTDREVFSSRLLAAEAWASDPVAWPLTGSDVVPDRGALVTYEIRGSGFLRHMVRSIVGSLVEVGRGRQRPEWIAEILDSRSRASAGPTAPASGLFLVRVEYDSADL